MNEQDLAILRFEGQWWKHRGSKLQAVHDLFDMTLTRYYKRLLRIIDDPAAAEMEPLIVKRLQRRRNGRRSA